MLKKRDAQGLPIQVIILVVIGLIVLFVILAIFTKESGESFNVLGSCGGRGGECKLESKGCDASELKIPNAECPKDKPVCCKKIFE